jgi:membrane fusion protein, heavy metal efflux system
MIDRNLALLALCFLALAGCKEPPEGAASAPASDPYSIAADISAIPQFKVVTVGSAPVVETLRVAGKIDFDEQHLARIGATVTGRVLGIDAVLGQEVSKGDVLARLNSSELSEQQLEYLKARARMELNRRQAERAKALFDADVIAAAELQRRESEYSISRAETRAAEDQLRLLGVSSAALNRLSREGGVSPVTPVIASLGGVVVERKLSNGQVVQPADTLFVVADLSRVWAVAQVPEQQLGLGKLIYVAKTVNPETRTVLVRSELDNTYGRLKPAMLASMLIQAKPVVRLVVPGSSVVRDGDKDYVFVQENEGAFRLVPVRLGSEVEGVRPVIDGLAEGVKVVAEGAYHLNNERKRRLLGG